MDPNQKKALIQISHSAELIKNVRDKIEQALRIRQGLIVRRGRALAQYEKLSGLQKQAALESLKICFERESKFLDIVERGLQEGMRIIEHARREERDTGISAFSEHDNGELLVLLNFVRKRLNRVRKRLRLEEGFLLSDDIRQFKKFKKMWYKERKLDESITKILSSNKIKEKAMYYEKFCLFYKKYKPEIWGALYGTGASATAFSMGAIHAFQRGLPAGHEMHLDDPVKAISYFLFGVIAGTLFGTLYRYATSEKQVDTYQEKAAKKT